MYNRMTAKLIDGVVEMKNMKEEFCKAMAKAVPEFGYDGGLKVLYVTVKDYDEANTIVHAVHGIYDNYINPLTCNDKLFEHINRAVKDCDLSFNKNYLLGRYNYDIGKAEYVSTKEEYDEYLAHYGKKL